MRKRKLWTQILLIQLSILVATVLIGFALFSSAERNHLDAEYQARALAIAQTVAGVPLIREAMEYGDSGGAVQTTAERIRINANAAYIVVIDLNGVRHSHPNRDLIGQRVEEPLVVLDGKVHTGVDNGSLGPSANGKAPIYGPSGNLVGEVSAGILESEVADALARELPTFALYFGVALAVGAAASYLLARRLKRSTFGLELHEIATLLQEREAMLHGIREGVIALDNAGRLTVINDEARRLVGITGHTGQKLTDLLPACRLRDVLDGTAAGLDEIVLTDDHCLAINRMPVFLAGRQFGAIVTVRDRTELIGVVRELDNVRGLSEALRAQQHEFANRLHTIAGLIELGDSEQALSFITETQARDGGRSEALREHIGSPLIAALILGKQTIAAERGVSLSLAPDSFLGDQPAHPQTLLTVLGNLLDNAIDAAAVAGHGDVHLQLGQDDIGTTIAVSDTGAGVPPETAEAIFLDGYTTKPQQGTIRRGLGLALVHRVVARLGGTITVSRPPGATFTVWLPANQPPSLPSIVLRAETLIEMPA